MQNPPAPPPDGTPHGDAALATPSLASEPTASAAASSEQPVSQPVDLATRRVQRLQELLAAKLADPDPRAAVFGAAGVELLEFGSRLRPHLLEVPDAVSDPAQRLEQLMPGLRMYANLVRLADKLTQPGSHVPHVVSASVSGASHA